jgi:hypothetical protein
MIKEHVGRKTGNRNGTHGGEGKYTPQQIT